MKILNSYYAEFLLISKFFFCIFIYLFQLQYFFLPPLLLAPPASFQSTHNPMPSMGKDYHVESTKLATKLGTGPRPLPTP